ncbi:MAG TPA: menaquinone biosynthesis protein [Longimicrobiales bacterium]|nr:menaquinone biosynthesis protein [Longimicrobiales bacterium]
MLRVGHIEYSNCFPVHALLLDRGAPADIEVRTGVPSALNRELSAGAIDVAPSSSIEYARNADRYRVLPDFVIGSRGPVQSILLEADRSLDALDGAEVALPTASATSVVLLRALLELRLGVRPRYRWFDQALEPDPVGAGAAAALRIGDVALRRDFPRGRCVVDLGAAWMEWTRLPFAFAVWQTCAGPERDDDLARLHALLLESRDYFHRNAEALAARYAADFGLPAERLLRYWRSLSYDLDGDMQEGLLRFYAAAAELGEVPAVPPLRWTLR